MTYSIEKKTPSSNWYTIHRGFDIDTLIYFMRDVAEKDEDFNAETLTARYMQGGDVVQIRAIAED
jgi:hypothetical protein